VVASDLVPELVIGPRGKCEPLLPEAADGEIEVYVGNDGFEAYGYTAGGHYWAHFPGMASFRFLAADSGVVAIPEAGVSRALVEDAYHRNVLPLVLQLRGHEVLHASAVSSESGLIVLCGVSGAGKSTFAYGLSQRGYPVWADDAVALDVDGDDAIALQIPFRLGLRPEASAPLSFEPPGLEGSRVGPSRSPLHSILILGPGELAGRSVVDIELLEPTEAFTALLPHAYYFRLSDAARTALMVDCYLQLASSVAMFEVRYRLGLDHIDKVLDELEKRVLAR
jgi:hypothetical protein